MHLRGAGAADRAHQLAARRSAHDRVVDDDDATSLKYLAHRVELDADAGVASRLLGLDERAADVVVTDQSELEPDARGLAVAERDRVARVRHADDDVRVRRALLGQPLPDAPPHTIDALAEHPAVGP